MAYLLIALGAVLRLLRLNAVPGINGDEVYWAVAIDDAIGGKIGLLITPSGRWPDLVTIINGLWGWLCKQLAFGEGAHRYGYASVNLLASLSIYWITKPNFGKGFAYILCAFCLVSPSLIEMSRLAMEPAGLLAFQVALTYFLINGQLALVVCVFLGSVWYHPTCVFAAPFWLALALDSRCKPNRLQKLVKQITKWRQGSRFRRYVLTQMSVLVLVAPFFSQFFNKDLLHNVKRTAHPLNLDSNLQELIEHLQTLFEGKRFIGTLGLFSGNQFYRHYGYIQSNILDYGLLVGVVLLAFLYFVVLYHRHSNNYNSIRLALGLVYSFFLFSHIGDGQGFDIHSFRWMWWLVYPTLFTTACISKEMMVSRKRIARFVARGLVLYLVLYFCLVSLGHGSLGRDLSGRWSPSPYYSSNSSFLQSQAYDFLKTNCLIKNYAGEPQTCSILAEDFFIEQPLRYSDIKEDVMDVKVILADYLQTPQQWKRRSELLGDRKYIKELLLENGFIVSWSHSQLSQTLGKLSKEQDTEIGLRLIYSSSGKAGLTIAFAR